MLNQLGLPPVNIWQEQFLTSRVTRRARLRLKLEFDADVEFWRLMLAGALGSPAGTLHTLLYSCHRQPPSRTPWSDASGDVMGGYFIKAGAWWRVGFNENVRNRLPERVRGSDGLSINAIELLGMVVTALAFIAIGENIPHCAGGAILMRGGSMSVVCLVNHCRGGKEPRSGVLKRLVVVGVSKANM